VAEVVLFHSVLGVRTGVTEMAERLRAAGNTVHVPDLYQGRQPFDDYEPAMKHMDEIGEEEMMTRAEAAVAPLPEGLVYAGFSAGGASAENLAGKRAGARGLILFAAGNRLKWFGIEAWPAGVPVQIHQGTEDPFKEPEELAALGDAVRSSGASFQLFEYPVPGHLFSDPSLPGEYDAEAAELMYSRVLEFLAGI
jgi:dienelactone hydrolase